MTDASTRLAAALADRYRIERELGEGGMATVYLAEDLKHDRQVAIKVLRPELAAVIGAERFLAEIKTTANLQHPNILPLFDSGDADGQLFYVMPYVEGESLRDRIAREKQLPVDEVVRMGAEVADALDYAHRHGVVHRDIKPENILLHEGRALVADFGIALALSAAGGSRMTETGMSVGTPAYMSPEQAMGGHEVTARSDVYALGATLYEALVGEPPFTGPTAQAIIARLVTEDPRPLVSQRKTIPPHVEAAVLKALERLPADRFATAADLRDALEGRAAVARPAAATAVRQAHEATRGLRRTIALMGAGMLALAAAALWGWLRPPPAMSTLPPIRFVLTTTDSVEPLGYSMGAISPDGGTVVYDARGPDGQPMLYSLHTDELEAHPIPGTVDAFQPYFSPDGTWLAFEQNGDQRKVRLDGSAPVTILKGGARVLGAAWTPGGQIVIGDFGAFKGLGRVGAGGGNAVALTHVDTTKGEQSHLWPIATPDPNVVVFTIWYGALASSKLAAASLPDGRVTPLGISGVRPLAVVDGHLVYVQADSAVMAVPFDVRHERVTGAPVSVHDPVGVAPRGKGYSEIYLSTGGALLTESRSFSGRLVWRSPDGATRPAVPGARRYGSVAPSPDGKRIAAVVLDDKGSDVWIWDAALSTFSRLTTVGTAAEVRWSANGANIVYVTNDSAQHAVWSQPVAGGSPPRKLFTAPYSIGMADLSPDGASLVIEAAHDSSWALFRVALDSEPKIARPYVANRFFTGLPRFSPDGKWVAYESDETGQSEVYVRSFPDPSRKIQVSAGQEPARFPAWSADGSRLYYVSGSYPGVLLEARVSLSPTFRLLGRDTPAPAGGLATGEALPVGNRLLAMEPVSSGTRLVVSPNWGTELRERLAASKGQGRQ